MTREELERLVITLEEEMFAAAEELRFEYAAKLRDEIKDLRRELAALRDGLGAFARAVLLARLRLVIAIRSLDHVHDRARALRGLQASGSQVSASWPSSSSRSNRIGGRRSDIAEQAMIVVTSLCRWAAR